MRYEYWIGCLALLTASSAFGQPVCRAGWEYKVVDLSSADSLTQRKPQIAEARTSLEGILNRLGGQGWEIASQNSLMIYQDTRPDGTQGPSVAAFDPPAVLFKRTIEVCN